MSNDMIMVARFKRPHPLFSAGDVFVGRVWCGDGESVRGWGWSSRKNKVIGGRFGYVVRYRGWKSAPRWAYKACENCGKMGAPPLSYPNGNGYLKVLKWIENFTLPDEPSPKLRNVPWLRRLLIELSCGNLPLSSKEAAPSELIFASKKESQ